MADIAGPDVFADGKLVAPEVLEDHADSPMQRRQFPIPQIETIEKNPSCRRCIESGQEFDQRRLARTVLADQRETLPGAYRQIDVREGVVAGARIAKGYVFEFDAPLRIGTIFRPPFVGRHGIGKKLVKIGKVEIVLVHAADRRQAGGDRRLALPEQHQVHGHRPQADPTLDGCHYDPDIGTVECGCRYEPEHETPAVATQGQTPVLAKQLRKNVTVAVEKARSKLKELDLFDTVLACNQCLQVNLHATVRRAPAKQPERIAGEFCRFAPGRRFA